MKHVALVGFLALSTAVVGLPTRPVAAQAQAAAAGTSLGSVSLSRRVMLNGQPIAAGTYQVRLTPDQAEPGIGQSPESERYVEFLRAGKVVGRELATVVSNADIATVAKGRRPAAGTSSVELLKDNDYLRVWINRGGQHYLIHLPVATS
jgi:hypothetical protein